MMVWIALAIFLAWASLELIRRTRHRRYKIRHFNQTEAFRRDIFR